MNTLGIEQNKGSLQQESRQRLVRKPWRKPELVTLSIRQTRSGFIMTTFEGPFNFIFGVS